MFSFYILLNMFLHGFTCFMRFMSDNFCTSRSDWNFISATSSLDHWDSWDHQSSFIIVHHRSVLILVHGWTAQVLCGNRMTCDLAARHSNVFKAIPFTSRQGGWFIKVNSTKTGKWTTSLGSTNEFASLLFKRAKIESANMCITWQRNHSKNVQ